MAENFGIVVEIDPAKAARGIDALDAKLESLEKTAKEVGDKIGQALASGLTGSKAFTAQQDAASKAARAQEREATQARRTQEREAKAAAAAQTKAARDAERAQVSAAKGAAREQAKAAREAAAAQKREAAAATAALEKEARRQVAIERQKDPLQAAALIGLPGAAKGKGAGAGGAVAGLSGGLAAIGGAAAAAAAAKQVIELADAYTTLSNRLTTVTKSEGELGLLRQELFELSDRTRTDVNDTVQLYSTFGKSILDTGKSHKEVLPIIESVQQAVKLSGASSEAASQALIQLGQGMSAGALRGEELNSILEQAPVIADVIAKQLGVTRGELRKYGEQGKITTQTIISAFEAQRAEIAERFAKTVPTVSEQWVVFRNQITKTIGELNKSGALSKIAGAAFSKLGEVLKTIGKGVEILVDVFQKLWSVVDTIRGVFNDVDQLVGGKLSKAFGFLADQIKAAIIPFERLIQLKNLLFPEEIDATSAAAATAAASSIGDDLVKDNVRRDTTTTGSFSTDVDYGRVLLEMDRFIKLGEGARKKGERAIKTATGQNILESEAKKAAEAAAKLREEYARFADSVDPVGKALRDIAEAEALVTKAQAAGVPGAEKANEYLARKRELLRDQIDPYAAVVRNLEREIELAGLDEETRARRVKLFELENDLRAKGIQITDEQRSALERLIERQKEAADAAEELASQTSIAFELLPTVQGLFSEGIAYAKEGLGKVFEAQTEALKALDEGSKRLEDSLKSRLAGAFGDGLEALREFAFEGKNTFREFAASLLRDLSVLLAKMLLLKGVQAALGGGLIGGGTAKTLSGLITGNFAAGGSFLVPGSGSTDSQTVAFRATPGERVTVSRPDQSGGGGGGVTVNAPVRVVNVDDPRAPIDALQSAEGERVILNIITKNRSKLRSALNG